MWFSWFFTQLGISSCSCESWPCRSEHSLLTEIGLTNLSDSSEHKTVDTYPLTEIMYKYVILK